MTELKSAWCLMKLETLPTPMTEGSLGNRVWLLNASDAYLSLKSLSQYSGLSVRTLRGHLASRIHPLSHYRVGGKILVRRSDFDLWVSQFKRDADGVNVVVDGIMEELSR